jgi:hypothetical protein
MVETILEEVDDLLVGDVDYGGALVEEALPVLCGPGASQWSVDDRSLVMSD